MGNNANDQFRKICQRLKITNKRQIRRFHEYLNSLEYEDMSNMFDVWTNGSARTAEEVP